MQATTTVQCPTCANLMSVPLTSAGSVVVCPFCRNALSVPPLSSLPGAQTLPPELASFAARPAAPSPAPGPPLSAAPGPSLSRAPLPAPGPSLSHAPLPAPGPSLSHAPLTAPGPSLSRATLRAPVPPPPHSPAALSSPPPTKGSGLASSLSSSGERAGSLPPEVEAARADPKKRLGHYVILNELGKGGMGVVYRVYHERLRRIVALKMLLADATDRAAVERFEREGQAVARLRHPHIVAVHEVGEIDGKPFLAMDYIEGTTLERRVDRRRRKKDDVPLLPLTKAVEVVRDVARAIEHAHEQGVIHRDLKPANVMLDAGGHAFVMDFGLARVGGEGRTRLTKTGTGMGTPAYMPPEQAGDMKTAVDERSDVYSLGATLYHVLTGRPPFEGATEYNVLAALLSRDPDPPRAINPRIAPDLETIALRCLEKSPGKRYASAGDLADDLDRYLAGEPIAARSIGSFERLLRRARRNKAATVLALVALVAIVAGGAVALTQTLQAATERAAHEEEVQRKNKELEEQSRALADNNKALSASVAKEKEAARLAEESTLEATRQANEAQRQTGIANAAKLDAEKSAAVAREREAEARRVSDARTVQLARFYYERSVQWTAEGRHREAALAAVHAIQLRDTPTHRSALWLAQRGPWRRPRRMAVENVHVAALSPDGRLAATASTKGTWVVSVCDSATGRLVGSAPTENMGIQALAWSPDGSAFATAGNDDHLRRFDAACRPGATTGLPYHGTSLAWSPDGTKIAVGFQDGTIRLYASDSLKELATSPGHHRSDQPATVQGIDWWSDRLATASSEGTIGLWNATTLKELGRLACPAPVSAVAWRADGRRLVSGGEDRRVRVWSSEPDGKWHELSSLAGHQDAVTGVAFLDEGRVVSGSSDDTVRVWDLGRAAGSGYFLGDPQPVSALRASRDGRRVVAAQGGTALVWDLSPPAERSACIAAKGPAISVAFRPDSRQLAVGGTEGDVTLWSLETAEAVTFRTAWPLVRGLAYTRDGDEVVSLCDDTRNWQSDVLQFTSSRDGSTTRRLKALSGGLVHLYSLALAPDRGWLLLGGASARGGGTGFLEIYDAAAGTEVPIPGVAGVWGAAWSPDGSKLAAAHGLSSVLLVAPREDRTWTLDAKCRALGVAFSADGRHLATGGVDGVVRMWDASTASLERELVGHTGSVETLAYGPPGRSRLLATGGSDGTIRLWETGARQDAAAASEGGTELAALEGHHAKVRSLAFSPDGRWLASAAEGEAAPLLLWPLDSLLAGERDQRARDEQVATVERETGLTFREKTFVPVRLDDR